MTDAPTELEQLAGIEPESPTVTVIDPPSNEGPKAELVQVGPTDDERFVLGVEAVAALPKIPGKEEFLSLAMQARILSMSGAAPEAIRNNPQVAFHVAMVGRDLGISPTAAMELVDLIPSNRQIEGKWVTTYRISLSPELMAGQVRRMGLGRVVVVWRSNLGAVARAFGPNAVVDHRCKRDHVEDCRCEDVLGDSEFTVEDARRAGLVDERCDIELGVHWHGTTGRAKDDRCGCNQGYVTYPQRMFGWRAEGFGVDDWFPEASLGLYSPEALGAMVDDQGRPIDPASVSLPPGYEPPEPTTATAQEVKIATEEERAALKARIDVLPDDRKLALQAAWKEREIVPLGRLPENRVALVSALINLQERDLPPTDAENATETTADSAQPAAAAEPVAEGTESSEATTEPQIDPVVLEAAIGEVAEMSVTNIRKGLDDRGLPSTGNAGDARRALTMALALERTEAADVAVDLQPLEGVCTVCGRTEDIAQVDADGTAWCGDHQPFDKLPKEDKA
jgi:hypothetical protein